VRYSRWVSSVLVAVATACANRYAMCTVGAVAAKLGLSIDTSDTSEFTTAGRPGTALRRALDDLDELDLLSWSLSGGVTLSTEGRDAAEVGLESIWPSFMSAHLNPKATVFLARLVILAVTENESFADAGPVDPIEVASALAWPVVDFDDGQIVETIAQDLVDKDFAVRMFVEDSDGFGIRPTYRGIVRATETSERAGVRSGVVDWSNPLAGWDDIEDRIRGLKVRLDSAVSTEDFKDVGRRSRDLINDTVNRVFPKGDTTPHGGAPTSAETKRRFESYSDQVLVDDSYDELRAFMRKTLDLANATTHAATTDRLRAMASAQAAVTFVRIVQAVERTMRVPN
jgi:hypothetical protein